MLRREGVDVADASDGSDGREGNIAVCPITHPEDRRWNSVVPGVAARVRAAEVSGSGDAGGSGNVRQPGYGSYHLLTELDP